MSFSGIDETRTCKTCQEPFMFTVGEQQWMAERNYDKPPNKCKRCRKEARESRNAGGAPPAGGYNTSGGYNASGYRPPAPQPQQLVEQRVTPTDYRDLNEDNNRRSKNRKGRRGHDDDNGDW